LSAHEYLQGVLAKQAMRPADLETLRRLRAEIETCLRRVHGAAPRFYYGGSYGKNTLIRESFDLDIVMYFPSTETRSSKSLYYSVFKSLQDAKYVVRAQNVALRLPYDGGFHIDVVPGTAQDATFYYATLYKSEEDGTRQTSIKKHIDSVRQSDVRELIRLMKLWRYRNSFDWSSFALEQTTIRALAGTRSADLSVQMTKVREFIKDNILTVKLVDPANTNNEIEMPFGLRLQLKNAATQSLGFQNWQQVIA
jgi:hypothetical protein